MSQIVKVYGREILDSRGFNPYCISVSTLSTNLSTSKNNIITFR